MKLTRRVLAVIVAAAMLVGVMAIGAFAAVGDYDATSNPYTTKIGLKAYRVDAESGEYVEITDGKVLDGEVIRVEVWGQTNYYASIANYIMAYSNGLFVPTKLDGSTYDYDATAAAGLGAEVIEQVALDEDALAAATAVEEESGYATFDAPYAFNAAAKINTSFAGADSASTIKSMYPSAWKDASGEINATGAAYNVLSAGYGPDLDMSLPASLYSGMNMAVVMVDYQPLVAFNLTVDGDVNATGVVTLPQAAVKSSSNTSGRMYVSAATPNDNFDDAGYVLNEAQAIPTGAFNFSQYKDTYEDGTVADRVVDLSEGTINFKVVASLDGGDEPDPEPEVDKEALRAAIDTLPAYTEDEAEETSWADYEAALAEANKVYADTDATQDEVNDAADALLAAIAAVVEKPAVAPELVALGDTIIDEERGFIYGLPHGDWGGVADLVGEGYVEVTGDGSVVCTPSSDILGTGSKVELLDSTGAVVETYYVVIFGDTDGDGYITTDDVSDAKRWYAYLDSENDYEDFSNPASFAMEINGDDFVDDADFTLVKRYYAYLIDDVPQTR